MTLLRRIAGLGVGITVTLAAATAIASPPNADASAVDRAFTASSTEHAEIARIHAHFDSVLVELRQRDVSMLSAAQREARSSLTRTLQAYRDRSVFPHNYDFAAPTPYFVDRKTGTLCAVAHLLESTGRRDIVDRVARSNNNVWVAELEGEAELASWLDAHGLTLAEAARIQVPYVSPAQQAQQTTFMVAAPLSLVAATGTGVWNAWGNSHGQHRVGNILGVTSGVIAAALSSTAMMQPDANSALRTTAGAGVAIGTMTAFLSTRAMMRRGRYLAAKRDAERADPATRRAPVETSVTPIVPVGRNGGTGVSVSLRF